MREMNSKHFFDLVVMIVCMVVFSTTALSAELEQLQSQARDFLANRQIEQAIQIHQQIAQEFPAKAISAEVSIARSYYGQGKKTEAINSLKATIEKYAGNEDSIEAIMCLGNLSHHRAMCLFEIAKANDLTADKGALIDSLLAESDTQSYSSYLDQAIANYKKIVTTYPSSVYVPQALCGIGLCHLEKKEQDQGFSVLSQVIADYPKSREAKLARLFMAEFYVMQKMYENGLSEYEKIISDAAFDRDYRALAQLRIGEMFLEQKKYDKALKHLEIAANNTAKNGISDDARISMGKTYREKGEYDLAIAEYKKVSPYGARNVAEANLGLGSCYRIKGEIDLAIQCLNTAQENAMDRAVFAAIEAERNKIPK